MSKKSSRSQRSKKGYIKRIPRDNLTLSKIPSLLIGLGIIWGIGMGGIYFFTKGLPAPSKEENAAKMANPASVSCKKNGGQVVIQKDLAGNEVGLCKLKNGTVCEEWILFQSHICQTPIKTADGAQALKVVVNDDLKKNLPQFDLSNSDPLLDAYGRFVSETLGNNPQILQKLQKLDPTFNDASMQVGSENKVATFKDKAQILLLIGCIESSCAGSVRVVAFDPQNGSIYMLSETPAAADTSNTPVLLYGNPSERIEQLLLYFYITPS